MKLYMINTTDPFYQSEIKLFLTKEKAIESKMEEFEQWYETISKNAGDSVKQYIQETGYEKLKEKYMDVIEEIEAI